MPFLIERIVKLKAALDQVSSYPAADWVFAFERNAMIRCGINDIHLFHKYDHRFQGQFRQGTLIIL